MVLPTKLLRHISCLGQISHTNQPEQVDVYFLPLQELGLQPEDNFILKVVQLEELLHVRHSIFVIGNAGTGKSKILRSLNKTYQIMKRKPVWQDLNPKAVTNDELFGYINPATREWKDGIDVHYNMYSIVNYIHTYMYIHRHYVCISNSHWYSMCTCCTSVCYVELCTVRKDKSETVDLSTKALSSKPIVFGIES